MHPRNGHLCDGRSCGIHAAPPRPMVSFSLPSLSSTLALDPPPLAEREEEAAGWFLGSHKVSFFVFFFFVVVGGVRCLPQRPTPPPPSQQPQSQTNRLAAFSFPPSPPLGGSGWVAWGKGRGKRKEKKQLRRRRHRFLSFLSSRLFSNFVCIKQKVSFLSEIQQGSLKFAKLKNYFLGEMVDLLTPLFLSSRHSR